MATIPDGTTGTLINGVAQPLKFVKVDTNPDTATETFALKPEAPAEPVDTPEVASDTGTWIEGRRAYLEDAPPVLPSWLRKAGEFTEAARWTLSYAAHVTAFHAVRLPVYLVRLLARSPRGAGRLIIRWGKWVADTEARPVEAKAAATADIEAWLSLSREKSRRVRPRRIASVAVATATGITTLICGFLVPGWTAAAYVAAAAVAGVYGKKGDKPLITRYLSVNIQRPLDSGDLIEALEAMGIKGDIKFVAPIQVDGPGWLAEMDLPRSVLAEKLLDRRKELAGALRRPLQCVWPSVGTEHPSRVNLWVAKRDPRTIKRPWPLLAGGKADLYGEFPFGVTPRGETVTMSLIGTNVLIGGVMGSGKTSAVMVIALAGALDVTCEMWLFELKGSGDAESVQPVCHRYVQGDDDEHCEAALEGMHALEAEMKRRKKIVSELPIEDVPHGRKVTRKLANKYPHLRLHPILAIYDEVHTLFEHAAYGKEAEAVAARLIRKARAYGIILVLTTQRPDANSIPKKISDNAIVRFCLAITGHVSNDLVLGTGMYKRGIRANIFEPAEGDDPKDSGTGWLTRSATNARIVRSYFIPQADAREVGKRALAMRTAAGTLTGEAAGEEVKPVEHSTIVDHLHYVWPDGAETVHSHRLVDALAAYLPELYASWLDAGKPWSEMTVEEQRDARTAASTSLSAALKPHKVPTRQITIRECCGGAKGVRYADLPDPRTDLDEDD